MSGDKKPTPPHSGAGVSASCDNTIQSCPFEKLLKGEVVEVAWESGIKVSRSKSTVANPHWKTALSVNDGLGSERPGVYLVKGKGRDEVTVKVKITENKNVSGNGTLVGWLGSLEIKGNCPTAVGVHKVNARIKSLPDSIQHFQGDIPWGLEVPDLSSTITLTNTSRLEVFVVLDMPALFYDPPGVWVEVLRFLCDRVGIIGMRTSALVARRVSEYCHGSHGLRYDTDGGRSSYGMTGSGGTFQLNSYIKAVKKVVNCYDQAGGVQSLCGAVGVYIVWYYLQPYGYINTTNLIGVGSCNNPFFTMNGSTAIVPPDDSRRTAFGNHAFGGLSGKVLDACAGPHVGTEDKVQYCAVSIESTAVLYSGHRPGAQADIIEPSGVSNVI